MKPLEVTKVNEMELWEKQQDINGLPKKPTYKLLDYVRISRLKGPFLKNFDQNSTWLCGMDIVRIIIVG